MTVLNENVEHGGDGVAALKHLRTKSSQSFTSEYKISEDILKVLQFESVLTSTQILWVRREARKQLSSYFRMERTDFTSNITIVQHLDFTKKICNSTKVWALQKCF